MGLDEELACMLVCALHHPLGTDAEKDRDAIEIIEEAGKITGQSVEDFREIGDILRRAPTP
jgi:hypothetical protein